MGNYNWDLLRSCADVAGEDAQVSMESVGLEKTVAKLRPLIDIGEALGKKYDVVVEATGTASGFETSMSLTKPRGVLVLKSTVASGKELNLAPIVIDEITVLGSRCGQFPPALRLLKNKRIDFTPFISGIYSIDDAIEAFEANKDKESIQILIKM